MIEFKKRTLFYLVQQKANAWLLDNFSHYVCNWQDFSETRVYENFTCKTNSGDFCLLMIYYKLGETIDDSEFYTYKHTTNF